MRSSPICAVREADGRLRTAAPVAGTGVSRETAAA